VWLVAGAVIMLGVVPCAISGARTRDAAAAVTAMQTASSVVVGALLLLTVGFARSIYADVALVAAALSFGGTLVFVRALEAWR
jgi:multisubunit Na+/H+ antiporter MnhF subunit